jgi:TolB-like protein/tetratricopeptide (TPR) repeat protein
MIRPHCAGGSLAGISDFIAELRRRRVVRAVLGWGILSFAVLQIYEPVMHGLHLPEWTLTMVVVVLGVGFPATFVLAWIFDMGPGGVERTPYAAGEVPTPARRVRTALLLIGLGLLISVPGWAWYARHDRARVPAGTSAGGSAPTQASTGAAAGPSIAVLPFDDLSPGHDQEYFSDGVAGEILNALSRVEGLKVTGRASSFWFKGRRADPPEIAQKLGVTHLLEGSVRRSGSKIRIDAEVIRAADGSRIWAQTFDREQADVFAIQDEIARAVVQALKVRLLPGQVEPVAAGRPTTPEAYRLYLLGRHLDARSSPDDVEASVTALREAVRLDPTFVPARAWLIRATADLFDVGPADPTRGNAPEFSPGVIEEALRSADKLVKEAPDAADVYALRGHLRAVFFSQWPGALEDFQKALALSPNDAMALLDRGRALASVGRLEEARDILRRVTVLDPLMPEAYQWLGTVQAATGDLDQAVVTYRRGLEIDPSQPYLLRELGFALLLQGKAEEALALLGRNPVQWIRLTGEALAQHTLGHDAASRAAIATIRERERFNLFTHYQLAQVHAWRGEKGVAFQELDRAFAEHDAGLAHLRYDPFLQALRADSRYGTLVRKLGLPPLPGE